MKSYLVLGATALALMLSGCGGGSSNDNSAASTPERTHFVIKNSQSQDIAKITYVSDDNETIFDANFTCKVNEQCDYYAVVGKSGTVFLYNQSNVLLSAYPLAEAPTYIQFITPSDHMTGVYVYQSLVKKFALTNFTANEKLATFFSNFPGSDGVVNIYARLGQYFKKEVVGKGVGFNEFLQHTNASLTSGQVLRSDYVFALYDFNSILAYFKNFINVPLINSAHAISNGQCTALGAILPGAADAIQFIPIAGNIIAGVLTTSSSLVNEACDDTGDKLREINEKIDQISADLKAQNQTLSSIADAINKNSFRGVYDDLVNSKKELSKYLDLYTTLLGSKYTTLSEYVKDQGGLEKAYKQSPNFQNLVKGGSQQGLQHYVAELEKVGAVNQQKTLNEALEGYCKLLETETGDLVAKRTKCNLWQLRYKPFVLATWANNKVILRDIVSTISAYTNKEESFINNNLVLPGVGSRSDLNWSNWTTEYLLNDKMSKVTDQLALGQPTSVAEHGMFPISKDLNKVSRNNWDIEGRLKLLGCSVTSWLPSQDKIIASCKEPNLWATYYFNSEVYYKEDDDLVNYAGVLVPRKLRDYTNSTTVSILNPNPPSMPENLQNNLVLKNARNVNFETLTMFDTNDKSHYSWIANATIPTPPFEFHSGDLRFIFTKDPQVNTMTSLFYRLTDKTSVPNMSYIFGNRFSSTPSAGLSYMFCVSAGCEYQGHRLGFKDGPQNIWYGLHVPGLDPHTVQWEINGQKQAY